MVFRVTEAQVHEIMEEEVTESDLTPYIKTANLIIDTHMATVYSEDILTEIELWLSAHYASSARYRQIKREEVLDTSVEYNELKENGLLSTTYGNMVIMLDSDSILQNLQRKKVKVNALTNFNK